MARPSRYPLELRRRAVRMVAEMRDDHPTETAALQAVAEKLGIGSRETLRNWVKQQEVDAGTRPGTTTEESAQLKALKRENAELKRANEILKAAASFFAAELDRPQTELIKPQRPWKSLSQVELATAEWVGWYNHRRLHGEIGHVPPVEHEANHYMESTKRQVTTII